MSVFGLPITTGRNLDLSVLRVSDLSKWNGGLCTLSYYEVLVLYYTNNVLCTFKGGRLISYDYGLRRVSAPLRGPGCGSSGKRLYDQDVTNTHTCRSRIAYYYVSEQSLLLALQDICQKYTWIFPVGANLTPKIDGFGSNS